MGSDTLLIFPSLIKQKRPLQDDLPATDDISYVVRGRVENLYASLVVLLGYTPSFSRINQWQNQAQYEMGAGEICGFRLIEEREGEIELVLYYGDKMPSHGRDEVSGIVRAVPLSTRCGSDALPARHLPQRTSAKARHCHQPRARRQDRLCSAMNAATKPSCPILTNRRPSASARRRGCNAKKRRRACAAPTKCI